MLSLYPSLRIGTWEWTFQLRGEGGGSMEPILACFKGVRIVRMHLCT